MQHNELIELLFFNDYFSANYSSILAVVRYFPLAHPTVQSKSFLQLEYLLPVISENQEKDRDWWI